MKNRLHGAAIVGLLVALGAEAPVGEATWWKLAYEGELKGRGTALTRKHFEEAVANFARYGREVPVPLYHADLDATAHPESRKAHAWLTELRVGTMKVDGKDVATLEGRPRWVNESTRADVKSGALACGSVTLFFNAKDEASGERVGAYLYSFSLTNNPALTKLPALAASQGQSLGYWCGELEDRDDVLAMLRCILDLPATAPEADVTTALRELDRLVVAPDPAGGVDATAIVGRLRESLRLPALTPSTQVLAEVRRALATMPGAPAQMSRGAAALNPEIPRMSKLLMLAALLGATPKTDDEAADVIDARVRENLSLRTALNLSAGAPAGDVAAALSRLTTDAAQIAPLKVKLEAFEKREAAALETLRKGYIDDVMLGQALPDAVRPSLELHAASDWTGFQKAHPRPSREELAQRAQDPARLARPGVGRAAVAPKPTTGDGATEPSADDLDAAATELMQERDCSYAEALEMLGEQG